MSTRDILAHEHDERGGASESMLRLLIEPETATTMSCPVSSQQEASGKINGIVASSEWAVWLWWDPHRMSDYQRYEADGLERRDHLGSRTTYTWS